jgi:hypothetical protein
LAWDALKALDELVEKLHSEGQIKDKDYQKLSSTVTDYKQRMKGYHH